MCIIEGALNVLHGKWHMVYNNFEKKKKLNPQFSKVTDKSLSANYLTLFQNEVHCSHQ